MSDTAPDSGAGTERRRAAGRPRRAGDPDAFAELVRRHRDRLWAVALRTLGDREEAADAVQEALLSAFRRADTFRGDAAVTTWLHRIVVNACLDRVRRRTARPTTPLGELDPAQRGDDVASAEQRLDVARALARIPGGAAPGPGAGRHAGAAGQRGGGGPGRRRRAP